jgi:hypothetical protein
VDANSLWFNFQLKVMSDSLQEAVLEARANDVPDSIIRELVQRYRQSWGHTNDPEPLSNVQQSAPKNGTSPTTSTGDKEMDNIIQDLTEEPKPKRKPKAVNPQSDNKRLSKEEIVSYLNRSKLNRRTGYTADQLRSIFTTISTTRTYSTYLNELWKEGRIKKWRQAREAGEQIAYRDWFSSTANPDPKYVMWITK